MNDEEWLATRTLAWAADAPVPAPAAVPAAVVAPTYIAHAVNAGYERVIAVAGYPTGRHHTLVKAAEARLAIQTGAAEVWVCVDGKLTDPNSVLSDLVAIRDACPPPARLGLLLLDTSGLGADRLQELAARAGYDLIIAEPAALTAPQLAWVARVPGADTDAIIAALDAGAEAVAV